jgi:hypothetical protein
LEGGKVSRNWWSEYFRTSYIPTVEQFVKVLVERLLPQFSSVADEAEALAQDEHDRLGRLPGDENVDMADLAEKAQETAIIWYQNMMGTQQSLINLYAVGLRHLFEQQIYHFVKRAHLADRKYANYDKDRQTLQKIGVKVEILSAWPKLEELRMLCNCVKHAEGSGARDLKETRPELFIYPGVNNLPFLNKLLGPVIQPLAGEDVYVTPEHLMEYAAAIREFWVEVGNYTEALP